VSATARRASPDHEREIKNSKRPSHRDKRDDARPGRVLILAKHDTVLLACTMFAAASVTRRGMSGHPSKDRARSTCLAEQHHQHGKCAGRGGEAEQGLEEQHGSTPNRVMADALTWPKEAELQVRQRTRAGSGRCRERLASAETLAAVGTTMFFGRYVPSLALTSRRSSSPMSCILRASRAPILAMI